MNKSADSTSTIESPAGSGSSAADTYPDRDARSKASQASNPARPIDPIRSPLHPKEAVDRLNLLSKRGKLPGFERESGANGVEHFRLLVFGNPYDRELRGTAAPSDSGSEITLESRLLRRMPTITIVVLILAIFPGVLVTHSMLNVWFSWYNLNEWWTAAWYVPLCILALPALWKQYRKSEKAAAIDRGKRIEQVLVATEGKFANGESR